MSNFMKLIWELYDDKNSIAVLINFLHPDTHMNLWDKSETGAMYCFSVVWYIMKDLGKIFTACNILVKFKAARYWLYKLFFHFKFCGVD